METIKLLFVCEDAFNACEAEKLFKDTRFKIVGATNDGKNGIALIEKLKPDILVCGMAIKGADGLTVIKKAVSLNNDCKVMVLSAIQDDRIIQRAFDCGALDYVITPLPNKALKERIIELSQKSKKDCLQETKKFSKDLKEKLRKIYLSYGILTKYNY